MKTQLLNAGLSKDIAATTTCLVVHTRNKIISAADVWNIQRHKRSFGQRRFCI